MLIVFGNQKGGCGKSTNCIQFANFLSSKGKDVILLDMDFQKSVSDRRKAEIQEGIAAKRTEESEVFDNELPYEIEPVESEKIKDLLPDIKKMKDIYVLLDLPGRIDDEFLADVFFAADYIIIPFSYDKLTLESTGIFISALQALKINAKKIFLPNRLNNSVKYETIEDANPIFAQFGSIAPPIPQRVALERISTLGMSSEVKRIVNESYSYILSEISKK